MLRVWTSANLSSWTLVALLSVLPDQASAIVDSRTATTTQNVDGTLIMVFPVTTPLAVLDTSVDSVEELKDRLASTGQLGEGGDWFALGSAETLYL